MSRSAIPRRFVFAGGLVFIAILIVSFSAVTSGLPAKLLWRATGAEHALMLSRSATSAGETHAALTSDDRDLAITAVPEPGVIACLIGGVALLLSLRRRHG